MINVMVHGWVGRMGQVLSTIISETDNMNLVAGVDSGLTEEQIKTGDIKNPDCNLYKDINECQDKIDVIIDFSNHKAVPGLLGYAVERKIPTIVATTGLTSDEQKDLVDKSKDVAIFKSANMSLGINLMAKALKMLTPSLEDNYNIEIIEKHHNQKKDAPSGTAILLADAINDVCEDKKEYIYGRYGDNLDCSLDKMGIHAVRGGTIAGEHTVLFAGPQELIEIKHTALSRDIFAHGAISAAAFLAGKGPGLYDMNDVIE